MTDYPGAILQGSLWNNQDSMEIKAFFSWPEYVGFNHGFHPAFNVSKFGAFWRTPGPLREWRVEGDGMWGLRGKKMGGLHNFSPYRVYVWNMVTRWWFQICFTFHPYLGFHDPNLTFAYFSKGLVKNHQPDMIWNKWFIVTVITVTTRISHKLKGWYHRHL